MALITHFYCGILVEVFIWICDFGLLEIKLRFQDLSGPSPLVVFATGILSGEHIVALFLPHCPEIIVSAPSKFLSTKILSSKTGMQEMWRCSILLIFIDVFDQIQWYSGNLSGNKYHIMEYFAR